MRTKQERRLDSVARLLERNHLCAAVAVFNGKLLYTTNSIYETEASQRGGSQQVTINKVKEAIDLIEKKTFDRDGEDGNLFVQIVLESFKAFIQKGVTSLDDDKIRLIARNFLADNGISEWKSKTTQEFYDEYKTFTKVNNALSAGLIAERLATDLLKARHEFHIGDDEESLSKKGLIFELVLASKKEVHAEMTLLNHIINEGYPTTGVYIGISKKCCAKCNQVIESVNKALSIVNLNELVTIGDSERELNEISDVDTSSEEVSSSSGSVENSPVKVSGSHPQKPNKWEKPDFLDSSKNNSSNNNFKQKIQEFYKKITDEAAPENANERVKYDMMVERSPSPPPIPSSVFEPRNYSDSGLSSEFGKLKLEESNQVPSR